MSLTSIPIFYDAKMVAEAQSYSPSARKQRDAVESWNSLRAALVFNPFHPASREQLALAHSPEFVDGVL